MIRCFRNLTSKPCIYRLLSNNNDSSSDDRIKPLEHDQEFVKNVNEFELSKVYLEKMMGYKLNTQEQINEAIEYLFPSGLTEPKARPMLVHPLEYQRKLNKQLTDNDSRPLHTFFYTNFPLFNQLLYDTAYIYEKLKSVEDNLNLKKEILKEDKYELKGDIINFNQICQKYQEKIKEEDYNKWFTLMNRIINHSQSNSVGDFIEKQLIPHPERKTLENIPKLQICPETKREYVVAYGQKRWTSCELKMFVKGTGIFLINNMNLLANLPNLSDRENVLSPLAFTNRVNKVDIHATASITGQSSLSYALRLGIARAISCIESKDMVMRMRLAGLLTQDDRFNEAKLPGQPKARKKAVWRHR